MNTIRRYVFSANTFEGSPHLSPDYPEDSVKDCDYVPLKRKPFCKCLAKCTPENRTWRICQVLFDCYQYSNDTVQALAFKLVSKIFRHFTGSQAIQAPAKQPPAIQQQNLNWVMIRVPLKLTNPSSQMLETVFTIHSVMEVVNAQISHFCLIPKCIL